MDGQTVGVNNNADVRKALRFFKERRASVHFIGVEPATLGTSHNPATTSLLAPCGTLRVLRAG
jgi:hypothetical protein